MKLLTVRQGMTQTTLRYKTMLAVATCTTYLAVLTRRLAPLCKDFVMTGTAGSGIHIFLIADLQRLVHRMTLACTGFELLPIVMRFVAGIAAGNISVNFVAIVACQLGMFTREFLQLLDGTAVTNDT